MRRFSQWRSFFVVSGFICAAVLLSGALPVMAQPPADLSPEAQEVLKLAKARMSDDVIASYIKNSGKYFVLSSDDIIYLSNEGVSQAVINAMLHSTPAGTLVAPAIAGDLSRTNAMAAPIAPTPVAPLAQIAPAPPPAGPAPSGILDSFSGDPELNPSVWSAQSEMVGKLAGACSAVPVAAGLTFGPAGMEMSGVSGPGQFMGIQSVNAFYPPFTFNATVAGRTDRGIPFEVFLVSHDLRQWVSVAEHLGVREPAGDVHIGGRIGLFRGGVDFPLGGEKPDHGVWLNYTGSGMPISMLGRKIYDGPLLGVAYTVQVSVGPDGMASIGFLGSDGAALGGARAGLSVGTGPFYVVLAGRNGQAIANWQSVELNSSPPAAVEAPIPETPTIEYFQSQLSSYGTWSTLPGLGLAWIPTITENDPGWRPYVSQGHWDYTDAGWYWQSDYQWGDIAFHYGRWLKSGQTGGVWAWVPGYHWAPAWVCWRYDEADGVCGWAPLPPGARFEPEVGLTFNGGSAGDVDFGLRPEAFVFVGFDHFWEPKLRAFLTAPGQADYFFARSIVRNDYRFEHGTLRAEGLGRERMATLTRHEIRIAGAHDLRQVEEHDNSMRRAQERANIAEHRAAERLDEGRPGDRRDLDRP